jgi:hypothetical protein
MARTVELQDGTVEIWNLFQEQGSVIRCYPNGRIELFEVTWGGEHCYGDFPSVEAAQAKAEEWT